MAPESIKRPEDYTYTPKADIWALGVSASELLSGINPFGKPAEFGGDAALVFERIRSYSSFEDIEDALEESPAWTGRTADAAQFVQWLLALEPAERPDAAEALEHCWLERHKDAPAVITSEMLRGLAGFAEAPPLARYCLYIVAARLEVPDLEHFGAAFMSLDTDGDGRLSKEELSDVFGENGRRSWWGPVIDVDALLTLADMENKGGLSFTEFVAACLLDRHGCLEELITSAFEALDDDRDGLVRVGAIRSVFKEHQFPLLHRLPQDRPFDLEEWFERFTGRAPPAGRSAKPRAVRSLGFFDRLFDHFNCTPCRPHGGHGEYIIASTERLAALSANAERSSSPAVDAPTSD